MRKNTNMDEIQIEKDTLVEVLADLDMFSETVADRLRKAIRRKNPWMVYEIGKRTGFDFLETTGERTIREGALAKVFVKEWMRQIGKVVYVEVAKTDGGVPMYRPYLLKGLVHKEFDGARLEVNYPIPEPAPAIANRTIALEDGAMLTRYELESNAVILTAETDTEWLDHIAPAMLMVRIDIRPSGCWLIDETLNRLDTIAFRNAWASYVATPAPGCIWVSRDTCRLIGGGDFDTLSVEMDFSESPTMLAMSFFYIPYFRFDGSTVYVKYQSSSKAPPEGWADMSSLNKADVFATRFASSSALSDLGVVKTSFSIPPVVTKGATS